LLVFVLGVTGVSTQAQLGNILNKKDKGKPAPTSSEKAPAYSEADKAKMAEIAQRPAVQEEIQAQWDEVRKKDLNLAYVLNRSAILRPTEDPILGGPDTAEDAQRLYSNPMMQMYVNNIGQRLVPKDSPNLYTFRIILDPLPRAFSLSTGSIYISSGLLSMLDSEAQLGYILAHEVAHVEQKHEYAKVRNAVLEGELNKEKELKNERTKALIDVAGALGGAAIGGAAKGLTGAAIGGLVGLGSGVIASEFLERNRLHETDWSTVDEDEADELGAKYMLDQGYDPREIPRLYATLDRMVGKDSRVGLGFMGNPRRVKERTGHIQQLLNGSLKPQLEKLKGGGGLVGSGPQFAILLAAAKRDNGILAMQYDLFDMAKSNLEDALAQRSSDPSVHFYLSRIDLLTARTPEDRREAVGHIADAIRLDTARGSIPDLHLEMALSMLMQDNTANKDQIITELKTYVALYQRDSGGGLPGNMSAIFDYFNLVGETGWYLPPEWYPATQLMNSSGSVPALAPGTVVRRAISSGGGDGVAAADNATATPAAPAHARVQKTSARKPQ
jgi:hypothetical protein